MRLIGGFDAAAYVAAELRWRDINLGRRAPAHPVSKQN
jgi:hypothetical protein